MRRWTIAVILTLASSSAVHAQLPTLVEQLVQSGATGWLVNSGSEEAINVNVFETTTRGPDGSALAYIDFNLWKRVGPDTYFSIFGSGYVPAASLKLTGSHLQFAVADLRVVPDYYLGATLCDMSGCAGTALPDTVPVDLVWDQVPGHSTEQNGITRRHIEHYWQAGASTDIVEVGKTSGWTAYASGVVGPLSLPLQTQIVYAREGGVGFARGVTVTIQRTP